MHLLLKNGWFSGGGRSWESSLGWSCRENPRWNPPSAQELQGLQPPQAEVVRFLFFFGGRKNPCESHRVQDSFNLMMFDLSHFFRRGPKKPIYDVFFFGSKTGKRWNDELDPGPRLGRWSGMNLSFPPTRPCFPYSELRPKNMKPIIVPWCSPEVRVALGKDPLIPMIIP